MTSIIEHEQALQREAKKLDILPSKYIQAMERFGTMQKYLSDGIYAGATPPHDIYLQGSFKLGTEIRPYKDSKDANYDIDMVCCLNLDYETQNPNSAITKHTVGDHLKRDYHNMLDPEGKRCWTVDYTEAEDDDIGFHIDIVPSIPETSRDHSIAITNKDSDGSYGSYSWSTSNPKGFANWFYAQNAEAFRVAKSDQKRAIFEANVQDGLFLNKDGIPNIDEVPNIHVKTPLQRAIQLLKRHRDVRFCGRDNEKCKPISMIITVLAAEIYQGEDTIYATLQNLINRLSQHANQMQAHFVFNNDSATSVYRLITKKADGTWYIPNPANDGENFADKWHETENGVSDARAKAFFDWVQWAREDFVNINEIVSVNDNRLDMLLSGRSANGIAVTQSKKPKFNVTHRDKPTWEFHTQGFVKISGLADSREFESGKLLYKNCSLNFTARTDITEPFDVHWQVVNNGTEARQKRQLRGNIFESRDRYINQLKHTERTLYSGPHWIQCFIVKNEVCVAESDPFLVMIGC